MGLFVLLAHMLCLIDTFSLLVLIYLSNQFSAIAPVSIPDVSQFCAMVVCTFHFVKSNASNLAHERSYATVPHFEKFSLSFQFLCW